MTRYRPLIYLVCAHLALVAVGAANIDVSPLGRLGRALDFYGQVTGSSYRYGFFSPGVGSDIRAQFDVVDAKGQKTTEPLLFDVNREADLRVADIIEQFLSERFVDKDEGADEKLYRSLAASLSGAVLGRHPEARDVTIRLEEFEPGTMEDYRNGYRPEWEPLYMAHFRYDANQTAGDLK